MSPLEFMQRLAALVPRPRLYDAWGKSRGGIGVSSNVFGFTGHERDETGLYYFKARFYDPDIGRFLTEDLAEGDFNNPPSLHK
jgi:RHS repeat-associated protein